VNDCCLTSNQQLYEWASDCCLASTQ